MLGKKKMPVTVSKTINCDLNYGDIKRRKAADIQLCSLNCIAVAVTDDYFHH